MFKVLKIAMIGGILVAGANAEDFLAKVTAVTYLVMLKN